MHRLKVLISSYACRPGGGSEPGVGWNVARGMAEYHDVWVLTRSSNREAIEAEMAIRPVPGLQFAYFDLPQVLRHRLGVQVYYYLWQLAAGSRARALHQAVGFDLAHHLTFVRYWSPSCLSGLGIPFLWGPVGGGESTPASFRRTFGLRGRLYERLRDVARRVGELDPQVRKAARSCSQALATTRQTEARLRRLGVSQVQLFGESGLSREEQAALGALSAPSEGPARFLSLGRLLHWKGYHLGLEAFAHADLPGAEYWIVGDGPERARLQARAAELGVADRVRLPGRVPRQEALRLLAESHALVHPSLHDSGGWVCLEAMAAGRPVLCLDLGGPAMQVPTEAGMRVAAESPEQAVTDLATAMIRLATTPALRRQMGEVGRLHVARHYTWRSKLEALAAFYAEMIHPHPPPVAQRALRTAPEASSMAA